VGATDGIRRGARLSRVGLLGAVLALAALLLGDFAVVRPNRLAPGEGLGLFQALPAWQWAPLLAGVLLLGGCAVQGLRLRRAPPLAGVVLVVLLALGLLAAQGAAAHAAVDPANPFGRYAVGPAFWLALLGLFVAFTDSNQRLSRAGGAGAARAGALLAFVAGAGALAASGMLADLSLAKEYVTREHRFFQELRAHLFITGASVGSAAVLGLPLGTLAYKWSRLRGAAFNVLNIVQTIPSLALFGLLIAPLAWLSSQAETLRALGVRGIGWAPAVIALCLYALLPIVRNTFAGFRRVEPAVLEAGRGIGMGRLQLFLRVELPVALPIIVNGLRIAGVQIMGNTAVAALIGAGGFGVFIFQGLGQSAIDLVLLGAVPTILLAVALDMGFQALTRTLTPRGLR
jgi:osmoprotectant transport system permease protein